MATTMVNKWRYNVVSGDVIKFLAMPCGIGSNVNVNINVKLRFTTMAKFKLELKSHIASRALGDDDEKCMQIIIVSN